MVSLVRFGCIFSATIVGWTIVGLVLLIPLAAVLPRDLALAAGLLAGGTGAYVTLVRTRRLGSPKATTEPIANRDQHAELPLEGMQPTQSGIDPPGAATPADPSNPLALEAKQVIAMSRGAIPMVATPAMSRTIWSWRLGGVLMGILITVLVYFPAGEPDAGEVTWALAL